MLRVGDLLGWDGMGWFFISGYICLIVVIVRFRLWFLFCGVSYLESLSNWGFVEYSTVLSFLPRAGAIGELGSCRWVAGVMGASLVLRMVDCWVVGGVPVLYCSG